MNLLKFIIFHIFVWLFCLNVNAIEKDSVSSFISLDAVEVNAKSSSLKSIQNQEYSLQLTGIDRLPQFLGSTDPVRTLQLLPGVQTMGEGSGGLYVEGCNPSHNLILLDGAPVYNPIHMGGLFSVFNADHLGEFTLKKNYISPEFGGCLAGVLVSKTKTIIPDKFKLDGNLSLIVSNATMQIPLNKKSQLIVSGRSSYLKPVLNIINNFTPLKSDLDYSFYDINVGYNYSSEKDDVKINIYGGSDFVSIAKEDVYAVDGCVSWSNFVSSINWIHRASSRSKVIQTICYSGFSDKLFLRFGASEVSFLSEFKKITYKNKYEYAFLRSKISLGSEFTQHYYKPQYLSYSDFGLAQDVKQKYSTELGVWLEVTRNLTKKLSATLGLRMSAFLYKDSLFNFRYVVNPEPRFNLKYDFTKTLSCDISVQKQVQYLNQVITSSIGFPSNFWVMSSDIIPYQKSYSYIIGATKGFQNNRFQILSNIYYRDLRNQFESSGYLTDLFSGDFDESSRFHVGNGDNYGIELLLKKNTGMFTGWLSYTLSKSMRTFDDINQAGEVPSISDRPHVFNAVVTCDLSSKWDLSSCFVYASGVPTTFSKGAYVIGESAVNEYPSYNSNKLPSYHRLDISLTRSLKIKYFRYCKLNLSVYNVYARENPYLFSSGLSVKESSGWVKIRRNRQILFSVMPSIGFKFGL